MHFMRVCFKDDKTQSSCGISGADSGGGGSHPAKYPNNFPPPPPPP